MKKITLTSILILLAICVFSQNTKILYNVDWALTNSENAHYYRLSEYNEAIQSFDGEIEDYFIDGKLQMTGMYKDGMRQGEFVFYYNNGQVEKKGKYENGERIGTWNFFYENGQNKFLIIYEDKKEKIIEYFDEKGNLIISAGNGKFVNQYSLNSRMYSTITVKGKVKDGNKIGEWKCYANKSDLLYKEKFDNGEFVKRECTNCGMFREYAENEEIRNKIPIDNKFKPTEKFQISKDVLLADFDFPTTPGEYWFVIEEMPVFVNGEENFQLQLINDLNIILQKNPLDNQKVLTVKFLIDRDGSLNNITLPDCDNEAVLIELQKAFEKYPKCNPGRQRGETIIVEKKYTFDLQ
jgi:hypothetical protein